MARPVVILFARAPRLGQVKRRLAKDIGEAAALRFYRTQLARIIRELQRLRGFETILALTPRRARLRPSPGFARIPQGKGDLGQRMAHCCSRYRRRQVILIGADIPSLDAAIIKSAAWALKSHDAAFGPAADGGFYLVAMGTRRPAAPFARVQWSTPETLAGTLVNFCHLRVAILTTLHDVDTGSDLKPT